MSSKHRVLIEKYFRNSKYIQVVNQQVGCQDFKKYCDDNKDYKGQFDFMLNTFNTIIELRNCFVCASDLKMIEKISKSQDIIGNYLYLDYNEETKETKSKKGKIRYGIRFIRGVVERHSTYLYRRITYWYENFLKNATTSSNVSNVIDEIQKEMLRLENVGFDNVVKQDIDYKKNKNSDYKIYISKFDELYTSYEQFIDEFISNYNNSSAEPLTDEEISRICLVYTLVAKVCNGLTIYSQQTPNKDYGLNERSTPQDYYNAYLDSLNLNTNDFYFRINSSMFMLNAVMTYGNSCAPRGISLNEMMNNFDMYYFLDKMANIVNDDDFVVDDRQIRKDILDLKSIYETLMSSKSVDDVISNMKVANEIVQGIIKRNEKYFIRVS